MSIIPQLPPSDHQKLIYNVSERAILDPFKKEYVSLPTPAIRRQFFLSRIWPSMYRYWHEKEGPLDDSDWNERSKILSEWMHNNWRLPHRGGKVKGVLTVRKSDVIWNTRQEDVWVEIAKILGVPEANTRTPKWFPTRPIAIQNILSRMNENDKAKLDEQVRDIEDNGYSEDQKRSFAEKYCTRRMDTTSKSHWLEMGLLTLSVIAYRRTDGKLSVEIHENASTHVGVMNRSFDDEYDGKAREIRRVWLDYVRNILEEKSGGPTPTAGDGAECLCTSADGFPLFPQDFPYDKLKKKQCEKVLREYFKRNYLLATGRQSEDVPYKDMTKSAADRKKFVADKYLPRGFVMRDPHNLKVEESQKLIKFLLDRQASHDPAQVFRFHTFKLSRKGSETTPTIYPDEIDPENPPALKKKVKRQPRTKSNNPPETSPDAENLCGADQGNITSNAAQLEWDNPNMFKMTPTPEPPDRPDTLQVNAAAHVEERNTFHNAHCQTQPAAQSNGAIGADFNWDYPSPSFSPRSILPPNAGQGSVYWNAMAHHITPGPHQMLVGDWTPHFSANEYLEFGQPDAIGTNSYDAGMDGIDYGVPLNMPTNESDHDNGALAGLGRLTPVYAPANCVQGEAGGFMFPYNQTGYTRPYDHNSSAWEECGQQPQAMQQHLIAAITGNTEVQMMPVTNSGEASQVYNSGESSRGTTQMNADAGGTVVSAPTVHATAKAQRQDQRARGQGSSTTGVSVQDSGKGKRTADVLAAEEARIMSVPAKRKRRARVRVS